MRQWFRITATAEESIAHLYIYDEIGKSYWSDDTVSAKDFLAELKAIPESIKTIRVHVSSLGGNPFEALAIANGLRAERTERGRTVEIYIEGIAASAATIVTCAGLPIKMADNALLMVHDPSTYCGGTSDDLRKMADVLDQTRDAIVATYRWVSSLAADAIVALMKATTWMDAETAVANGFATEVIASAPVEALFTPEVLNRFGAVPEAYRGRVEAFLKHPPSPPVVAAASDVLRLCREGECLDVAEGLIAQAATLEAVRAVVTETKQQRAQAKTRADQIRTLCTTHRVPALADGYITGAMSLDAVRAHVTTITAMLDRVEIDGGLQPGHESKKARIDPSALYAARNGVITT